MSTPQVNRLTDAIKTANVNLTDQEITRLVMNIRFSSYTAAEHRLGRAAGLREAAGHFHKLAGELISSATTLEAMSE